MKKNRVRFPCVRSPQQNYVRLFDFAIRACSPACSEYRRQTGDARRMSSPVAAINVVRTHDAAHEFLRRIVQLVGGLRATEHPEVARVLLRDRFAERRRHALQRFIPGRGTMPSVLPHQRLRQPPLRWLRHASPQTTTDYPGEL